MSAFDEWFDSQSDFDNGRDYSAAMAGWNAALLTNPAKAKLASMFDMSIKATPPAAKPAAQKGEPVAWLMTDVRTGLKRVTVQYSDHGMHDAITPLYAAPTTGDKT